MARSRPDWKLFSATLFLLFIYLFWAITFERLLRLVKRVAMKFTKLLQNISSEIDVNWKKVSMRESRFFFFYQMPRELSIRATMGRGKWTESPKRRKRKPAKWRWRDVTRQFPRALGHAWISAKGRQFRFLQSANLCPVPEFSRVISRWLEFKLHRGGFNARRAACAALLAARENTRENFSLRAIGSLIVSNIYETQASS